MRDNNINNKKNEKKAQESKLLYPNYINQDQLEEMRSIPTSVIYSLRQKYGCFQNLFRQAIWCKILDLPYKKNEYEKLMNNLKFDSNNEKGYNHSENYRITRLIHALNESNINYKQIDYITKIVYPFVIAIDDDIILYEVMNFLLTRVLNKWIETFPLLPDMDRIISIISNEYPQFYEHIKAINCPTYDWIFPFLKSLFSNILKKDDWLILWDFIISQNQWNFIIDASASALILYLSPQMIKIFDAGLFIDYTNTIQKVNIRRIIYKIKYLLKKYKY